MAFYVKGRQMPLGGKLHWVLDLGDESSAAEMGNIFPVSGRKTEIHLHGWPSLSRKGTEHRDHPDLQDGARPPRADHSPVLRSAERIAQPKQPAIPCEP